MIERIVNVRGLVAYKKVFDTAMEIFELSKFFPRFVLLLLPSSESEGRSSISKDHCMFSASQGFDIV